MVNVLNYKSPNEDMEIKEKQIPLIIQQKRFLEDLLRSSPEKIDYLEQPATYLEGEPEEFRKRVFYLCLRGLRDGLFQAMLELEIKTDDPYRVFMELDISDHIGEGVKRRLLEDSTAFKYLAWCNSKEVFEGNCENIARGIAMAYSKQRLEKELKRCSIR